MLYLNGIYFDILTGSFHAYEEGACQSRYLEKKLTVLFEGQPINEDTLEKVSLFLEGYYFYK